MNLRSRIAPTPSGYLHLGNAFSFLLTWLLVRREKGQLLLRIDDLDADRKRPECVRDIFDSLEWLDITYDDGPQSIRDFEENWSQHVRMEYYHQLLDLLRIQPGMVFACSCSRKQIAQGSGNGRYPGTCAHKHIALDTPDTALRLFVEDGTTVTINDLLGGPTTIDLAAETGSFVIRRRDDFPAYQVASLADDLNYGINFIVRGRDLLSSTAAQLFLADKLGRTSFTQVTFLHHPLLLDGEGHKLSKSEGALALKTMRENGVRPQEVYARFAQAIGLKGRAPATIGELLDAFSDYDLQQLRSFA